MSEQATNSRHVLAVVPTKDRLFSTLPLTVQAIAAQTRPPQTLLIYNDGGEPFPRADPLYHELLTLLAHKGVAVEVMEGRRRGQHLGHQASLETARDLIWRVDDDEVPEPDTLARLLARMSPGVGAVAPLVIIPRYAGLPLPGVASGRLEDCLFAPNLQWFFHDGGLKEAEHLYSSFLYSRRAGLEAGGYRLDLSPVASREETLFTHALRRAGHRLLIDTSAVTWHLQNPRGGIRAFGGREMIEALKHDELIFLRVVEQYGTRLRRPVLVRMEGGTREHQELREMLPGLRERFAGEHLMVAAAHPELLAGAPAQVIPAGERRLLAYYQEISPDGRRLGAGPRPEPTPAAPASAGGAGAGGPSTLSFYLSARPASPARGG